MIAKIVRVVLLGLVIAVAAVVTRDFVRYTDHFPYLALDDALGNVSYSLATHGQYGFPASPIQAFTTIPRNNSFFNYGPWYFYAGSLLIWMFGYSIGLLRGLHLLGILAIAATACWWFGRRRQLAAGALVALALLYSFDVGQWPMVRPDIAVSVFAVLFIVAAGRAIDTGSAAAWFVAGVAAGCGALTHLIAWALVPCAVLTLAIALAGDWPGRRRAAFVFVTVVAGLLAAAAMFYASFGFRIRDHITALSGYSGFLSKTAAGDNRSILATHLEVGFWYMSTAGRVALAASVVAALGILIASWRWPRGSRTPMLSMLLPPLAVLGCYVASLASYANYHAGYGLLPQVAAFWCAGASMWAVLSLAESRVPTAGRLLAVAAVAGVVVAGAVQLSARVRTESNPRLAYVHDWVSIGDYTARVGSFVADGTTAWGMPVFGIDSPGRFELVDTGAGLMVVERARVLHKVDTSRIAPSYLVWAYGDNRDNTIQALNVRWRQNFFNRLRDVLAPFKYTLVGIVAASPYGVTRIYRRLAPSESVAARLPLVDAFNKATQTWDTQLDGPLAVKGTLVEPAVFHLRFASTGTPVPADSTIALDLPAGRYLLRVSLHGAPGATHPAVLAASSSLSIDEQVGELGPTMDFSPYAKGDGDAYLFQNHPGGVLYVSRLDKGQQTLPEDVEVYRIGPALREDQRADRNVFTELALDRWVPLASAGVHAGVTSAGVLEVSGDASKGGYQVASPSQPVAAGSIVTLRSIFELAGGRVCVGALNRDRAWLASGGDPLREFKFAVDATGAFEIVFYNCNPAASGNAASRFNVSSVRYAVADARRYVETLLGILDPVVAPPSAAKAAVAIPPVPADEVERIRIPIRSADLAFRAPNLVNAGEGWRVSGAAQTRFSYLLRADSKTVKGHRLVVTGVVRRGGLTIGLIKDDAWAASTNVTVPGPFAVTVDPPDPNAIYVAVVANNIKNGPLTTDVSIERVGWAPLER